MKKYLMLITATILIIISFFNFIKPNTIRIGFIGDVDGKYSNLSRATLNGIRLFLNQNKDQLKQKIELLIYDVDPAKPDVDKIIKFSKDHNIKIFFGPILSATAKHLINNDKLSDILFFSPIVNSREFSKKDDNLIKIYSNNDIHMKKLAEYICFNKKLKNISIIYDIFNSNYTNSSSEIFKDVVRDFNQSNIKSNINITEIAFNSSDKYSVKEIINKIPKEVDCVLLLTSSLETSFLVQTIKKKYNHVSFFCSEWSISKELIEYGGEYVNGITFLTNFNSESRSINYLNFKREFIKTYSYEPDFAFVQAYDLMNIIHDFVVKQKMNKNLLLNTTYDGLQSKISFDKYGDVHRSLYITTIQGNIFHTLLKK